MEMNFLFFICWKKNLICLECVFLRLKNKFMFNLENYYVIILCYILVQYSLLQENKI